MTKRKRTKSKAVGENGRLCTRREEAEKTPRAIRAEGADAVVVGGQVRGLEGRDVPYRIILETTNEGAALLREDGSIFYCNRRFAELLHIPVESLLGSSLRRFVSPAELPTFDALLGQVGQDSGKGEFNLQRADCSAVPVRLCFSVLGVQGVRATCVVATDLAEQKQAEESLKQLSWYPSENPNPVLRVSAEGVLEYSNAAADIFLQTMHVGVGGAVNAEWQARITETFANKHPANFEFEAGDRTFDIDLAPVVTHGFVNVYGRDITVRKERERELIRISRLYAALSQINQVIVWTRRREDMLEKVCRVLVEVGGFRMAWIGQPDVQTWRLNPVARWGDNTGYLSQVTLYADDRPEGRGPAGTALREGRNYICNDFVQDPNTLLWREHADRAGFRSMAAFPIRQRGAACGTLTIYSGETGFFRDKEIALLDEAASDISFALDNLLREEERQQAEAALLRSESLLKETQRLAGLGSYVFYPAKDRWISSDVLDQIFGIDAAYERSTAGWAALIHPDDRARIVDYLNNEVFGKRRPFEKEYRILRHNDQRERWVQGLGRLEFDTAGRTVRMIGTIKDITERKLAETALYESENRLQAILESTGDGILAVDGSGEKIIKANRRFLEMWRIPPYLADGQDNRALLAYVSEQLSNPEEFLKRVQSLYETDVVAVDTLACKDGRILERHGCPIISEGAVTGRVWSFRDFTERHRAEVALRQSEERYTALFERSLDCVFLVDFNGRFLDANQALLDLLGYQRGEIPTLTIDSLLREDELPLALRVIEEVKRTGHQEHPAEFRLRRKDGGLICMEVQTSLIYHDGIASAIQGIARDLTERNQVLESHARLGLAVEQAAETIIITDINAKILYANPAFEKATGYTRAEVLGQNPRFLKSSKQAAGFYRCMWDVLKRGEVWSGHLINRRKDGTLFEEEATISPLRDAAGQIINYVAVKRDVTREVNLETQFRQAQKMEAFGQLAGGVAHDFNNILAVIQLQAGMLKAGQNLSLLELDIAGEIEKAAERGASLTRQLLLFSRRQAMQTRDLNLKEVIENFTKMLRRTLGERFQMQFKFSEEPVFVHADEGMIDQILLNLAVNARDAMPKGGNIVLETSAVEFDEVTATQSLQARPGCFVCLSVSDTGCGIPPEILPRIFEPFFTTKGAGKGTGLGLATVFGIVQQHKGWIHVYSEVHRGSTFRVYLPRLTEVLDKTGNRSSLASWRGGNETILLVEDESAVRASVRAVASRLGYRVLEASTGDEALEVWSRNREAIQLLLTDLVMPGGMTGKELAEQLLQSDPKLKVIYASGYSAEIAKEGFLLEEGVNFLTKPFEAQKLAQTIRNRLDQN